MVFENVKMKELTAVQQWDGQQSSQRNRVGRAGWKCRDKESESDKSRNEKEIGTMSHFFRRDKTNKQASNMSDLILLRGVP